MHRGRQQKRIVRQPLQSSSSSAATAAAAVAAAGAEGAEAAWRGLDRVSELCWQTTDRGLQRRAMMFSCMAEALAMTGWPDEHDVACHRTGRLCTGRARQGCLQHLRKGEARRRQIGHERRAQVWECVVGQRDHDAVQLDTRRICGHDLDQRYQRRNIGYKTSNFAVWDAEGQDKIWPM